jgi:hypothetical protein
VHWRALAKCFVLGEEEVGREIKVLRLPATRQRVKVGLRHACLYQIEYHIVNMQVE